MTDKEIIKRLEKENAELKAYMDVNEDFKTAWEELKAENARLKEEIKKLEDFIKSDGEIDHINHEYTYKLKQTLQEIKAIAERQLFVTKIKRYRMLFYADFSEYRNEILQKITKAEEE